MEMQELGLEQYCKYHQAKGHDTEDCWGFETKLESMFKSGELPLLKLLRPPNNNCNPFGLHDSILATSDHQSEKWNLSIYITSTVEPKPKMPPHKRS